MKPILAILITMFLAVSASGQQSLGDIARQNRNTKKATSTVRLDDDNMPRKAAPEPETTSDQDKTAKDKDASKDAGKDKDKDAAKKDSADDQKSKQEQIQKGVNAQKTEIANLQRELDILQREQKLRAAAYYGDAGTMLRDSAKYTEESKKQQADIDTKKQALDAAQQKLADLEEQARKAGMSANASE